MKAQALYDIETRNAIVKDLLKKTPLSKLGEDRAGMECRDNENWCPRYSKYRTLWECNKTFWGYSLEQVLGMNLYGRNAIEDAVKAEARSAGKELSEQGLNRRANRLEDRISTPLRTAVDSGQVPGIYIVVRSWENIGAVAASSYEHASQLASVTYGALMEEHSRQRLTWSGPISRELLIEKIADASRGDFDAQVERAHKEYERKLAKIEKDREESSYITLIGLDMAENIDPA